MSMITLNKILHNIVILGFTFITVCSKFFIVLTNDGRSTENWLVGSEKVDKKVDRLYFIEELR